MLINKITKKIISYSKANFTPKPNSNTTVFVSHLSGVWNWVHIYSFILIWKTDKQKEKNDIRSILYWTQGAYLPDFNFLFVDSNFIIKSDISNSCYLKIVYFRNNTFWKIIINFLLELNFGLQREIIYQKS